MKNIFLIYAALAFFFLSCSQKKPRQSIEGILKDSPYVEGREEYINSPYVTAGNRVYMVGHQDGGFPELGWHVKGEMGGIWLHPIKLMDGFDAVLRSEDQLLPLKGARSFVNFPSANAHYFKFEQTDITAEQWQFVPDDREGLFVQFVIKNNGSVAQDLQFELTGHADLMPVWLGERTNMEDGQDKAEWDSALSAWRVSDTRSDWQLIYGIDKEVSGSGESSNEFLGNGISNTISCNFTLLPGAQESINLVIAGSVASSEDTEQTYRNIREKYALLLEQKNERLARLAGFSKLTIPDKELEQTFEWLKYNCDWLVREVPGIGTGISAGIPDYPWWFGVDSEYALRGYMAIGQTAVVHKTIRLLDSVSNAINGNGRIIHEMSTNGAVFNEGNINETPQFASLIWEIYRWNGQREFLEEYFPTIKKGLKWLLDEKDSDNNLFPDGFGMMEIHGLDSEMIDVASYTQRAFEDASKIAVVLGEKELAKEYQNIASTLKKQINKEFWSEDFGSYADFIGTDKQALHLIEDAIVRADTLHKPWAVEELEETKNAIRRNPSAKARPFVLHHNWVVNTPMEMQIADDDKAIKALNTAERFVNPFGVFVTGIDRDESAGSDEGSFKGSKVFSYTGAVMTLPTGVQAIAENNYGRPDKALGYLKRMTRTFSYALPGSMYEVSPDYGMMTQAWNIYSYAIPIIHQFFGIQPHAAEKLVIVDPLMPAAWNEASLEKVKVADNEISVYYSSSGESTRIKATQHQADWTLEFRVPKSEKNVVRVVEGTAVESEEDGQWIYRTKDPLLTVEISSLE
ncbi:MAG: glycogen debranching protein [Flavobacteriaceae bacterium]